MVETSLVSVFVVQEGAAAEREVSLTRVLLDSELPMFIIGTSEKAHLQLQGEDIAPGHASVALRAGNYVLQPRFPNCQVFVNGSRLTGSAVLLPNDEVRLGSARLRYMQRPRAEADGVPLPKPEIALAMPGASFASPPPAARVVATAAPVAVEVSDVVTPNVYHPPSAPANRVNFAAVIFAFVAVVGLGAATAWSLSTRTGVPDAAQLGIDYAYDDGNVTLVMFDADW